VPTLPAPPLSAPEGVALSVPPHRRFEGLWFIVGGVALAAIVAALVIVSMRPHAAHEAAPTASAPTLKAVETLPALPAPPTPPVDETITPVDKLPRAPHIVQKPPPPKPAAKPTTTEPDIGY